MVKYLVICLFLRWFQAILGFEIWSSCHASWTCHPWYAFPSTTLSPSKLRFLKIVGFRFGPPFILFLNYQFFPPKIFLVFWSFSFWHPYLTFGAFLTSSPFSMQSLETLLFEQKIQLPSCMTKDTINGIKMNLIW